MKKIPPKLTDFVYSDGEKVLHCPCCDSPYLHQKSIECFNRDEDNTNGNHIFINGDTVNIDRDISGNPSSRRQGLRIGFECEECKNYSYMSVYQHKGNTFIRMESD